METPTMDEQQIPIKLTLDQIEDLLAVLDFSMRTDPNSMVDQPIPDARAAALFDFFEAVSGEHAVFEDEEDEDE